MAELTKQALAVDNSTSFPNNNNGAISPSDLRAFNTNMIDSLVDEISYNADSASWNNSIDALEAFTSSQQPAFTALNAFTASQLVINSGVNSFTQSADGRLDTLEGEVANIEAFTASINEIRDNGVLQGYSTRFFFEGLVSASIVPNVGGAIATINIEQDGTKLNTASFNAYTASTDSSISQLNASSASQQSQINSLISATGSYANSASFAASQLAQDVRINGLSAATSSYVTESETASFARTNVDNNFTANQTFTNITAVSASFTYVQTLFETASVIYSSGSNQFGDELSDVQTLSGSVQVQGSLTVNGTPVITASVDISGLVTTSSFNAYTQSNDQRVTSLEANSASVNVSITNVNSATASLFTSVNNINTFTQSAEISINALNGATASYANSASVAAVDAAQQQSIDSLNAATSSYVTSAITASSLVTASFDNGTRNLTFTKGDAQTFSVNIPDVSGSTGNFATTGSNVFVGDQTINGNVNITGSFTASGLIYPTTDNGEFSFIQTDGNGNLSLQYVNTTNDTAYNGEAFTLVKGTPVYVSGSQGANPKVFVADAANANKMPVTYIIGDDIPTAETGRAIILGQIDGVDTTGYPEGAEIYAAEGGGWSLTRPSGSNSVVQLLGIVTKEGSGGKGLVLNPGPATLPNIQTGYAWVGDGTNQPIAVATSSFGSPIETGSFATTGSNTFTGTQTIAASTLSINNSGGGANSFNMSGSQNNITLTAPNSFFQVGGLFSFNNNYTNGGSGSLQFTAVSASTAFYSTNGTIFGQAFVDSGPAGNGFVNMNTISGSLVLAPSGFSNNLSVLGHLSASNNSNNINLVFKNNTGSTPTIISGSNNIFTNQANVTAGFNRYIGGSNNLFAGALPQITGSAAFPVVTNNNFIATGVIMRTPVSSSVYNINSNVLLGFGATAIQLGTAAGTNFERAVSGLTMNNNFINGTFNAIASKTPLSASVSISNNNIGGGVILNMDSSSINLNNTLIQGSLNVNNSYFPSTYASNTATLGVNNFINLGPANIIYASGSNTTFPSSRVVGLGSGMIGSSNVMSASLNGDNTNIACTTLIGQGLVALGTNTRQTAATMPDYGTVFVGRWNAIDGTKNQTAETIFAVGTGTSGSAGITRKTGFLIDSGSNTFVEGTLNVSGSSSFTGSLNVLSGSVSGSVVTNLTPVSSSLQPVLNIVTLTTAEYALITPDSQTLYLIV